MRVGSAAHRKAAQVLAGLAKHILVGAGAGEAGHDAADAYFDEGADLEQARPGLIVLAIFTFLGNYGSFFWPLVLIKSEHLRTLPIGMLYFDTIYGRQTNLIMAASVMNIVPLIILFIVLQKYLVKGIQLGAIKG